MATAAPDLPAPLGPDATEATGADGPSGTQEDLAKSKAAAYADCPRFHQRLTLPATDSHAELAVSYAVGGCQDASAPTVLFIGGLFGGRYVAVISDYLAEKKGIRVVATDRPGMGHSTPVPVKQRIAIWLETVPVLLKTIGATHVALVSHSCGVFYALNTLYTMPHILRPENRTVHLLAPFVPSAHSGIKMLSVASMIPSSLVRNFDSVVGFIGNHIAEPVGQSSAFLGIAARGVSRMFTSQEELQRKKDEEESGRGSLHERIRETTGFNDPRELAALGNEIMRRVFAEDTSGGSDDALLCLRKAEAGPWGVCDSYEGFPERLDEALKEKLWKDGEQGAKVVVKAMWAGTDALVGKGGEKYFDACFAPFEEAKETSCLEYRKESWHSTDHDNIMYPHMIALPSALDEILGTGSEQRE